MIHPAALKCAQKILLENVEGSRLVDDDELAAHMAMAIVNKDIALMMTTAHAIVARAAEQPTTEPTNEPTPSGSFPT